MNQISRQILRLITFLIWVALISSFWIYSSRTGLSALQVARQLVDFAQGSAWGPIVYIAFYTIQPIVFFPSTLITISAGYLYGPVFGTILSIIGSNLSSILAWFVGRFFGEVLISERFKNSMISRFSYRLRTNSFQSVLTMRLIYLPYDVVSYFSGFMRLSLPAFILGTMLGGLPGTISFSLFGSSVEGDLLAETPSIDPWQLAGAFLLFVFSISVSRLVGRFSKKPDETLEKISPTPPNFPPESI